MNDRRLAGDGPQEIIHAYHGCYLYPPHHQGHIAARAAAGVIQSRSRQTPAAGDGKGLRVALCWDCGDNTIQQLSRYYGKNKDKCELSDFSFTRAGAGARTGRRHGWPPATGDQSGMKEDVGASRAMITGRRQEPRGRIVMVQGDQAFLPSRVMMNSDPIPSWLRTSILPPWAWTICLTIARPRPVPPSARLRAWSLR